MQKIHAFAVSAAMSLAAFSGAAQANPDLVVDYTHVQIRASSPTADTGLVTVPMMFNTGYTQAHPFVIPCDVAEFSAGVAFRHNGGDAVYPELQAWFYLNGDEHQHIVSHGYNNTVPAGFDHRDAPDNSLLMSPGNVFSEGFIAITQTVPFWQWGFQGSDLPADQPVKMHLRLTEFSCSTYDFNEGGYSPACQVPDAVPWNNAVNLWIVRACH